MRLNMNETEPVEPMLPSCFLNAERTLATVRVTLSVAVSTRIGTPCGA